MVFSSLMMWRLNDTSIKKNILRLIYLDIMSFEKVVMIHAKMFDNPPPGINRNDPIDVQIPFYDLNSFTEIRKEIAKLSEDISVPLFDFYQNILEAEKGRSLLHHFLTEKTGPVVDIYNGMKDLIRKCSNELPGIKALIKKQIK